MDPALQKTLTFLSYILIGLLLKKKFGNQEQVTGIKNLILTIALPSTIFVALMGVEINTDMLVLPVLALLFNFLIFFISPFLIRLVGIQPDSGRGRTLRLLLPSLAPGLSCFPFILEYLGETSLADAALADVGNKFFVLIFLYIVAMNMFYRIHKSAEHNSGGKIKELLLSLVKEPINLIILLALGLLASGIHFDNLAPFLADTFNRLSMIMTPLVLIFIGLAVKLKRKSLWPILQILLARAGITLLISTAIILALDLDQTSTILLAIVFPLSSCSFWPFAHLSTFAKKETAQYTFDTEYAILVLALSLPISTMLILGILSSGELFTSPVVSSVAGFSLLGLVLVIQFVRKLSNSGWTFGLSEDKKLIEQPD